MARWTKEQMESHPKKDTLVGRVAEGLSHRQTCGNANESVNAGSNPAAADLSITESTDEQKLNKLEKDWLARMRSCGFSYIGIQSVTLKLGDDCRYTPDFTAISSAGARVAFETKGFFRDDAKVKLKVAARMFRHLFTFFLVTRKGKNAPWSVEEVKP